jgi:hypothetical protein
MTSTPDRVLRAQASLTDRDLTLMSWLYDHGVLTTQQISHALFGSLDFCQRRLLRLTVLGVLTRYRPQRWDGGTYAYHYLLDQLGTEIVAAQRCEPAPRPGVARTRRYHLTARANLAHLLGTNQFFVELAAYARTHADAYLDRWWSTGRLYRADAFYRDGDDPEVIYAGRHIRPDAQGIWTCGTRSVAFCLEHDTGTEALGILIAKVDRYERLTQLTARPMPVLFWLPTARRELHFHQRLTEALGPLTTPVATAARDHHTALGLSPVQEVWWVHGQPGVRQRLIDLPCCPPQEAAVT